MCGLSQHAAAKLLGISTESLKAVETALDIESISPFLIVRAAQGYEVTTDFLLGVAVEDDWERDPATQLMREWSVQSNQRQFEMLTSMISCVESHCRKVHKAEAAISEMVNEYEELVAAVERFIEITDGFNNIPGSARLLLHTKKFGEVCREAKHQLIRCKILPKKKPDD
ncbi:hypothetical protein [Methylotuvimicrobium sp. KM2]|uniref:hypothetical protein n=1 Tax=Methylotuvimicrobium sp. KM2 TaxID=3133976 RepID=UPI0031011AF6